jgi:aarF domain-containing kinase
MTSIDSEGSDERNRSWRLPYWYLLVAVAFVGSTTPVHSFLFSSTRNGLTRRSKPLSLVATSSAVAAPPLKPVIASIDSSMASGSPTSTAPVFPPPLSAWDRVQRAAKFWSVALPIVARYLVFSTTSNDDATQWDALHEQGAQELSAIITDLKGFYVKSAQIISSRQDLFPKQYTEALSGFTDQLDPMPIELVQAVVQQELLQFTGESLSDVFSEFDAEPLGSASVAQVHRAVLTPKYGGPKQVAVKVQRPSIESKLMGDIANLKAISKFLIDVLPLDYYTVFCELEVQLQAEFDFVAEAVAMDRIYQSLRNSPWTNREREIPLVIPRPIPGLVSQRVLVQDFLDGIPLSRVREEMLARGLDPLHSPEAKLFGRQLLEALSTTFGRTILETGFFHADPHPGNIFCLRDGRIGLIDYGQVKQINGRNRETLCKVMIALDEQQKQQQEDSPTEDNQPGSQRQQQWDEVGKLALELGVTLKPDAKPEAAAAVGMWLFDSSIEELPGGYDTGELSPNSPVKELASFPQELVLVGRSTILIKGLSDRLNIPWSLAQHWAPIAREVLEQSYSSESKRSRNGRTRFRDVVGTVKRWGKGRLSMGVQRLPGPVRRRILQALARLQEQKKP